MRTTYDHASRRELNPEPLSGPQIPLQTRREAQAPFHQTEKMIALIEPRAFLRECILKSLQSQVVHEVIGVASVEEWLKLECADATSLVILSSDSGLANSTAQDGLEQLAQFAPKLPVVVLSDYDSVDRVVNAIDKGARGYISTDTSLDVAIEAMKMVKAGGTFVPARSLLSAYQRSRAPVGPQMHFNNLFTARQAAVVEALRLGKANKTIAFELNMCESTVKVHVRNIMKLLKAQNRTQVAYLVEQLMKVDGGRSGGLKAESDIQVEPMLGRKKHQRIEP